MDSITRRSQSVGTPKSDDDSSFEIIKRFWSFGSTPLEIPTENKMDSIVSSKTETLLHSAEENRNALDDLTSPYSASDSEQQTTDDDEALVENCIAIGQQCLDYCREEQIKLQSLMCTANESEINQKINSVVFDDSENDKEEDKTSSSVNFQPKKNTRSKSSDGQLSSYLQIFEKEISNMYPRIVMAVLIGFIVSFILFFTYTVVLESMKMEQIQTFENMTKQERQEKEKYQKETDGFRETLMHKSYEEARHHSDELKECLKTKDALQADITSAQRDLYRNNLESKHIENEAKVKIETLRSLIESLKTKNQRLTEDLAAAKRSRNTYDYSVFLGLFVGLICVVFWGVNKYNY